MGPKKYKKPKIEQNRTKKWTKSGNPYDSATLRFYPTNADG